MRRSVKNIDGIVTDKKAILNELIACKEHGNSIAVWASSLNKGAYIYNVEEIREGTSENDMVIILKEKDLTGKTLQTRVMYLKEIEKVHVFDDPQPWKK